MPGLSAKGRSTAKSLLPACRRSGVLQLAFGRYPGWDFSPTRHNPADDPTRLKPVREPVDHARLARWSSNWLRLSILLICSHVVVLHCFSCSLWTSLSFWIWFLLLSIPLFGLLLLPLCGFHVTCSPFVASVYPRASTVSFVKSGLVKRCFLAILLAQGFSPVVAPMAPMTAQETRRAASRQQTELVATRVGRRLWIVGTNFWQSFRFGWPSNIR